MGRRGNDGCGMSGYTWPRRGPEGQDPKVFTRAHKKAKVGKVTKVFAYRIRFDGSRLDPKRKR
jgi:hypothetical protein